MAATDTFEWLLSSVQSGAAPGLLEYLREQRAYMLTLRSEDERQRLVNSLIEEVRPRSGKPPRR